MKRACKFDRYFIPLSDRFLKQKIGTSFNVPTGKQVSTENVQ